MLDTEPWKAQGNCVGAPTRRFFPERGEPVRFAKEACRSCVVKDACFQYAMDNDIQHGIWGGTSERERKSIRRRQKMQLVKDLVA